MLTQEINQFITPVRHGLVKLIAPSIYQAATQRPFAFYLKRHFGNSALVGVEVGVWRGENAKHIIQTLPNLQRLYLVDSYISMQENDLSTKQEAQQAFKMAKAVLGSYWQTQFILATSVSASKVLPSNLDFVYIDANHTYKSVLEDCQAWYGKLRVGGVLGGHDFGSSYPGVVYAAAEFAHSVNAKLLFGGGEWWLIREATNC